VEQDMIVSAAFIVRVAIMIPRMLWIYGGRKNYPSRGKHRSSFSITLSFLLYLASSALTRRIPWKIRR